MHNDISPPHLCHLLDLALLELVEAPLCVLELGLHLGLLLLQLLDAGEYALDVERGAAGGGGRLLGELLGLIQRGPQHLAGRRVDERGVRLGGIVRGLLLLRGRGCRRFMGLGGGGRCCGHDVLIALRLIRTVQRNLYIQCVGVRAIHFARVIGLDRPAAV